MAATATQERSAVPPPEVLRLLHDRADVFVERALGETPWSGQRAILRSVSRNQRTAVKSAHGVGKSTSPPEWCLVLATRRPVGGHHHRPTWRLVERSV